MDRCGLRHDADRRARDGALGTELGPGPSEVRNHGNAVTGLRHPFASVDRSRRWIDDAKRVHAELELGALCEGPPGLVHGGVSALILDQMLGEAAAIGGSPGMAGRLTVHYRRPTPLGRLLVEAWPDSTAGRKSIVEGRLKDPEGHVTVEAEGVVHPAALGDRAPRVDQPGEDLRVVESELRRR